MAFPVVESRTETAQVTDSTTLTADFTQTTGHLVIVCMGISAPGQTTTAPAGWNTVYTESTLHHLFWKVLAGDEGGKVDITVSTAQRHASVALNISGFDSGQSPEFSSAPAGGTSTAPDSASLTASWGSDDNLWVTTFMIAGGVTDDDSLVTATPTGFSNTAQKTSGTTSFSFANAGCATAEREEASATVDPAAWTITASFQWQAVTAVVRGESGTTIEATGTEFVTAFGTAVTDQTIEVTGDAEAVVFGGGGLELSIAPAGDAEAVTFGGGEIAQALTAAGSEFATVFDAAVLESSIGPTGSELVTLFDVAVFQTALGPTGSEFVTVFDTAVVSGESTVSTTGTEFVTLFDTATVTAEHVVGPIGSEFVTLFDTAVFEAELDPPGFEAVTAFDTATITGEVTLDPPGFEAVVTFDQAVISEGAETPLFAVGFEEPVTFGGAELTLDFAMVEVTGGRIVVVFGDPPITRPLDPPGFEEDVVFGGETLTTTLHPPGFDEPVEFGDPEFVGGAEELLPTGFPVPVGFGGLEVGSGLYTAVLPSEIGVPGSKLQLPRDPFTRAPSLSTEVAGLVNYLQRMHTNVPQMRGVNPWDILLWDGERWKLLPAGPDGTVLKMVNGRPQWAADL